MIYLAPVAPFDSGLLQTQRQGLLQTRRQGLLQTQRQGLLRFPAPGGCSDSGVGAGGNSSA
jgi:hypothetical protein